ncbi:MAG: leucine-rich repeat protein [Oscillospiraceae bacterium]|nr:leucine-rich repeat protein [Candidatus Ruminococcus equi]
MIIMCLSPYLSVSAEEVETKAIGLDSIIYETEEILDNYKPEYRNASGNEYIPEIKNANLNSNSNDLPSAYDSRDYGYVTDVRNQNPFGFCWSFGSTATIESNMLKNKLTDKTAEDFFISETGQGILYRTQSKNEDSIFHYDYFYDPEKGFHGGWPEHVAEAMADGLGPYDNYLMPFSEVENGYRDELRYYSTARLKSYEDYSLKYGFNDVLLKNTILENGGAAFLMTMTGFWQGNNKKYYYDNGTYVQSEDNHVVEVIGWDDNFDKTIFNPDDPKNQPQHNGAWICKNSWGTNYGEDGYIYISYDSINMEFFPFVTQSVDAFDKIYQYSAVNGCYTEGTLANVFTSERDETLEQVCFMNLNPTNGKIKIYKLNEGYTSPVDGVLIDEQDFSYNATGLHTIDTVNAVQLKKGDIFSVVVASENGMLGCSSKNNTLDIKNVGFYSNDGVNFADIKDLDKQPGISYPYIKAYTKLSGQTDKEKLRSALNDYETADTSICTDKSLLEKYDIEAQKAYTMSDDVTATQNEINNEVCLLNYYHSVCAEKFEINSKEDFLEYYNESILKNAVPNYVVLNSDLDMSGVDIDYSLTHTRTFSGTFVGNGHTVSNLTINTNAEFSGDSGLFGKLNKATVTGVKLENCTIHGSLNYGAIAGELMNDCTISECTAENCSLYCNGYAASAGGIVGTITENNNKIDNCKATGNTIKCMSSSGGIVALIAPIAKSYSVKDCVAENNEIESACNVCKTYPKDENSFSVYIHTSRESKVSSESFVLIDDTGAYIKEYCGKIEDVTNAKLSGDKWIVNDDGEYKDCQITYSEDYSNKLALDFNFENETILIKYVIGDESIEKLVFPNKIGTYPVSAIEKSALDNYYHKDKIKSITIEDGVCADGIRFRDFSNLEKISIGEGTTNIVSSCFVRMSSLKEATLPDSVKVINNSAFSDCTNLEKVNLGNGVEIIDDGAFSRCSSLKYIDFPESLRVVSSASFFGCSRMKVIFGKNIEIIEENAFGFLDKHISNDDGGGYIQLKNDSFVINGYTDVTKKYAEENGFKYVDLNTEEPDFDYSMFDMSIFKAGDADLDKNITIVDATVIQKYLAKLQTVNDYQRYNMRVKSCESTITIANATVIQKYLAKIIDILDYES